MGISLAGAELVFGLVVIAVAALSGWLHATPLSASILSLAVGVLLARTGTIVVAPDTPLLRSIVELTLLLTLFGDGLSVEGELLRRHSRPPLRALVLALPLTIALVGAFGRLLFPQLSWLGALLLGAVLSSTDPIVASSTLGSSRVPARVRHALNLESGLNDGVALPAVLFLVALASAGSDAGLTGVRVLAHVVEGALIGLTVALAAGWLLGRLGRGVRHEYQGAYALGVAFVAFGAAQTTSATGTIAAFVAGLGLTLSRRGVPASATILNDGLSAALQIVSFVAFGALVSSVPLDIAAWRVALFAVLAFFVARPIAIWSSFHHVELVGVEKAFVAWFGPKGVASMLFALVVLDSRAAHGHDIFEIAAYVIVASIVLHGLTDTPGARWLGARLEADGLTPSTRARPERDR